MTPAGDAARPVVLVVDDEPDNITVLRAALEGDFRIKAATSGEAALAAARAEPRPDIILLDVVMPGMGGLAACAALRADPATRDLPVVFVTSRDDPLDESEGLEAGAVDYIHKPVNPRVVRARVWTHLELHAARRELERQNEILRENARLREEVEAIGRHDLKSPLAAVLWAAGILAESGSLPERERKLARTAARAGEKMLDMINRSVDLLRMERGTYVAKLEDVDLHRLVREAMEARREDAGAKELRLSVLVGGREGKEGETFLVEGEELLLYSMVGNLVANAIEAAPAGSTVTARLDRDTRPRLSVHNLGTIPESIRDRFAEKFATARKDGGSGLGAYSARLIATTLGGDLSWNSSEEKGTEIVVRLR